MPHRHEWAGEDLVIGRRRSCFSCYSWCFPSATDRSPGGWDPTFPRAMWADASAPVSFPVWSSATRRLPAACWAAVAKRYWKRSARRPGRRLRSPSTKLPNQGSRSGESWPSAGRPDPPRPSRPGPSPLFSWSMSDLGRRRTRFLRRRSVRPHRRNRKRMPFGYAGAGAAEPSWRTLLPGSLRQGRPPIKWRAPSNSFQELCQNRLAERT